MRDPRDLRRRAGVEGDRAQDQYFLEDERVLDRMIGYATDADVPFEHVLEIGAGTGALTDRLLDRAQRVTAVERDGRLAAFLQREFDEDVADDRLVVMQEDVLDVQLPSFTASLSNLPYGISSEVIFRLLPRRRPIIVMVQREFGERMAAAPGTADYGRLSVTTQHYGTVTVREIVPPGAFAPPPPVESAIVHVHPTDPSYHLRSEDRFFDVVRALFTQRRKTVRNAIRNTTHISGIEDPGPVLSTLSEDVLGRRPGELGPETYARIANVSVHGADP